MADKGSEGSMVKRVRSKNHDHESHESQSKRNRYLFVGFITSCYVIAELTVAILFDSLALLSDGFHNFGDLVALAIAYWCEKNKNRLAESTYTYGFRRVEVLGGLANGWSLMALCLYVVLESIPRFYHHIEIQGGITFITIAALGLPVNTVGTILFARHGMHHGHSHGEHDHGTLLKPMARKERKMPARSGSDSSRYGGMTGEASRSGTSSAYFSGGSLNDDSTDESLIQSAHHHDHESDHDHLPAEHHGHSHGDLNMRAVFLHYLGDSISSLVVLLEGVLLTVMDAEWLKFLDPIASLIIVGIIVFTTIPLLKQCSLLVLQVCPVNIDALKEHLLKVQGVLGIHELHIWMLTPGLLISSLHFTTSPSSNLKQIQHEMRKRLHEYGVHHSSIQVEFRDPEQARTTYCTEMCVVECDQQDACSFDTDTEE